MVEKDPNKVSAFKTVSAICSCTKCDSLFCFAKRHNPASCSCTNCKESKTCLFYNNRTGDLKESHSAAPMNAMIPATGDNVHLNIHRCPLPRTVDSSRYVSDAMTNTYATSKKIAELYKDILGPQQSTIEVLKHTYLPKKKQLESPKDTLDLQPYNIYEQNAYFFASQEYPHETVKAPDVCKKVLGRQRETIEILKNIYLPKKDPCVCEEKVNSVLLTKSPGYIFELPNYDKKKKISTDISCDCIKLPNDELDPPGYIWQPPGHIFELQKDEKRRSTQEICKKEAQTRRNTLETLNNTHLPHINKTCCCSEQPKNTLQCAHTLDQQNSPYKLTKGTLKLCINVPPITKNVVETHVNTQEYICPTRRTCCNCAKNSPKPTENKAKHKHAREIKKNELQLCKNILEIQRHTFETLNNMYSPQEKACNHNNSQKNQSDSPGYIFELNSKDLTKKNVNLNKSILDKQSNIIETLQNTYSPHENNCNCKESLKNISETKVENIQELLNETENLGKKMIESKLTTIQTQCNAHKKIKCEGFLKTTAESPSYILELHTYKDKPLNCTQKCDKNMLEIKRSTIETLHKKYKKNNCECNDRLTDSSGYIYELQKYKQEPSNHTKNVLISRLETKKGTTEYLKTTQQKIKCNCNNSLAESPGSVIELQEYKNEPLNHTHRSHKNMLVTKKNTTETLHNTCKKHKCECNDRLTDSSRYIFELQNYQQEPSNHIQKLLINRLETNKGTIESLKTTQQKIKCNCNNSLTESPGFVIELQEYKNEPLNHTHRSDKNILETKRNITETLHNTCKKNNCKCNDRLTDSSGYIYELQKYEQEPYNHTQKLLLNKMETKRGTIESLKNTHQKIKCNCNDSLIESPGHVFELQNYKNEPLNHTQRFDKNMLETKSNTIETPHKTHKINNCECNDRLTDSSGYIYELQKYQQEPSNHTQKLLINGLATNKGTIESLKTTQQKIKCNCNNSLTESPGFVIELQEYKNEPLNHTHRSDKNILETKRNITETLHNTCKKNNCECNNRLTDSSGYIYELQKYEQEPYNHTQKLRVNKMETKRGTIESLKNTHQKIKCNCNDSLTESPGYVFELQENKKRNTIQTPHKTHKINNCECNDRLTDSSGYIFELQKYEQEPYNHTQKLLLNKMEIKRGTIESLKNTHQKIKCNCNDSLTESPGYVFELEEYKNEPLNHTQRFSKNMLETNRNTIETPHNTHQKKTCNCNDCSVDSPGYTSELSKSEQEQSNYTQNIFINRLETKRGTIEPLKHTQRKNNCDCNDSQTETPGYIYELPKYKQEPSNYSQKIFVNRLETKRNTIESLKNIPKKNPCDCKNSLMKSSGYILELPKYKQEPSNHTQNCCDYKGSLTNPPGYIFDLQKYKDEKSNNIQRLSKSAHETKTIGDTCQKKSCDCNTSSKRKSESGYIFELQKYDHEPSDNAKELCKQILETQKNTIEALNNTHSLQNNTCNCKKSGNLLESHKNVQLNIIEPNTVDTVKNKKISQKKPCICSRTSKSLTKNTVDICETVLGTQKTDIETLKEIYLPQKTVESLHHKLETKKNTTELCKNVLGPPKTAIETLKNIYMPPKYTLEYTKKYEYPTNIPISMNNNPSNQLHTPKKLSSGTAMLTAEVMDVPYTDFNDSLANKQPNVTNKVSKLSKYDIFKRIKEAYKACSCKVCECIVGKPTKNDLCQCKPCECNDCLSYLDKVDSKISKARLDHGNKCTCDQRAMSDIKKRNRSAEENNKRQKCDCEPCDCIKCTTSPAKICDCEPCQCLDCKRMTIHKPRTLVVAPVGENFQRVACTCSPCDCIECGQGYPAASNVTHEMSTGTNRHALCRCEVCLNDTCDHSGVDACGCERRNRVMSKPVVKDTHDYDIRTVTIVQDKPLLRASKKRSTRHDTIAMFAALPNQYPTFVNHNRHSNTVCSCEECECIACVCKEDAFNAIKSSQLFPSNKEKTISNVNIHNKSKLNSLDYCKCGPCECEICDTYVTSQTSTKNKNKCACDICDCLNCEGEIKPVTHLFNGLCKCSSCECADCEVKMHSKLHKHGQRCRCSVCRCERCFGDERPPNTNVHPIKKGEVLTPSTHRTKVQNLMLEKQQFAMPSSLIQQVSSDKDSNYNAFSKHKTISKQPLTEIGGTIEANINGLNDLDTRHMKSINKYETLNCDAYTQYQERTKGKCILNNNSIDNEISGSYFSGYSSFETSPKTSCHIEYGTITPMSQNKNKSCESSCNSSGYDYPEYLIQFPKSAVETCIKDVMELDAKCKFSIVPKQNIVKHLDDKMSVDSISEKHKLSQTRECNLLDSSISKLITTKPSHLIKQYQMKNNSTPINEGPSYYDYTPWGQDYLDNGSYGNYKFGISGTDKDQNYKNNESIQTREKNLTVGFKCSEGSKSSLKIQYNNSTEDCHYYNLMQNLNEFHVARKIFDYNLSEQKNTDASFPIEGYSTWGYSKQFPPSHFVSSIDILNTDEDYKRVQKTLKEAKEFSLELMGLLEMYEKANKEFESISEKLKVSHKSIFSGDFVERNEICDIEEDILKKCVVNKECINEIEHVLQEIHLEAPSVREVVTSTSVLRDEGKTPERTFAECENNNMISQKPAHTNLNEDILNVDSESGYLGECDSKLDCAEIGLLEETEKHSSHDETGHENEKDRSVSNTQSINKLNAIKPEENRLLNENENLSITPNNLGIRKKERNNVKNYKKYSKLLKRTIIISKRISVKNSSVNESKPVVKYCVTVGTSTTVVSEANAKEISDKSNLLSANISITNGEEDYSIKKHRKCEINQIMRKLDTVFGSVDEVSVSTSTDTYGLDRDDISMYQLQNSAVIQELEETKPWPILKKNFNWNINPYTHTKNKGVCIFPSLELDIKEAVQSISLQTNQPRKRLIVPHHENKALAKLQVEVKKLLEMPLFQLEKPINYRTECTKEALNIQHKSKLELELKEMPGVSFESKPKKVESYARRVSCKTSEAVEAKTKDLLNSSDLPPFTMKDLNNEDNVERSNKIPSIGGSNCSCDALKVGFMAVRRVSDHTVLVKWNVPRVLTKVQGYELLVDGRPVQKIFSPSKCMAVVTCLPHTDKVLLTIRTITSSVALTGHYPATTVIYRPRVK